MSHQKPKKTGLQALCLLICTLLCLSIAQHSHADEGPFFRLVLLPDKKIPMQEVELQIDGVPLSGRFTSGKVPAFIKLPPGQHEVSIHTPGQATPLKRIPLQLIPGYALTLASNPFQNDSSLLSFLDPLPSGRRQTTLSVYHVDPTGQPIDVLTDNGGRIFSNLAAGASARQKVNPVKVELTAARTGQILSLGELEVQLAAGRSYSLFFIPEAGRAKRLILGEDVFPHSFRP